MFPKSEIIFDYRLKWLVNIDFYIRLANEKRLKFLYVHEMLFENCMDDHKITNHYTGDMKLQLLEYTYLLKKHSKQMRFKQKYWYFIKYFSF
jgi:hypothetical protein